MSKVLYRAWSVRTYNIMLRYGGGLAKNAAEAEAFGLRVLQGQVRNAGVKTATEALRAAGYGVYQIAAAILNSRLSNTAKVHGISGARAFCNKLDNDIIWRCGL